MSSTKTMQSEAVTCPAPDGAHLAASRQGQAFTRGRSVTGRPGMNGPIANQRLLRLIGSRSG